MEDALFYEESGYGVAREWLAGRSVDFDALAPGARTGQLLVLVVAAFYYTLNGVRAFPLLLLVYSAGTALVPVYVYKLTRELQAAETVAKRAAWLVALSPAFVFWSGSLYKEGLTLLFLSIAAYHTLRLHSRPRVGDLIAIFGCVMGLWFIRYYVAIALLGAVGMSVLWGWLLLLSNDGGSAGVAVRRAILVGVAALATLLIAVEMVQRDQRVLLEDEAGILVELDMRRADSARSAVSGYLREESIDTPRAALQYFPLGLFYFLTVPFPWQIGSFRQNLIIPEQAFWLALYPLIMIGVARSLKRNVTGTVFLLVLSGVLCAFYALLAANVGTAYRMRSQVWLLWAPFAAWGWEVVRERRRQTREARVVARQRRFVAARAR